MVQWRALPPEHVTSSPNLGQFVVIHIFYARGLSHPAHQFLLGLL
jgi:hypothetical protein